MRRPPGAIVITDLRVINRIVGDYMMVPFSERSGFLGVKYFRVKGWDGLIWILAAGAIDG